MSNMTRKLIAAGTMVHVGGIPFVLSEPTYLLGAEGNFNLSFTTVDWYLEAIDPVLRSTTEAQGTDAQGTL